MTSIEESRTATRSDRWRVAVWGLGRHAIRRILPAVASTEHLKLYGVCSRHDITVADCAERWGCRGWTDPSEMLRDPDVDVVYVATPIGLHFRHGEAVLEAGKHLWCEKPLTTSVEQAISLAQASRARSLSLCEGLMYLHHAQFRQLNEYLAIGRFGSVKSIDCRFGVPPLEHVGFRAEGALQGGAFFDVGCYPVSALHAFFPHATANVVASRVLPIDHKGLDKDGYATIELSSGVVAHLEWRRDSAYRNEVSIWGELGSVFTEKIFSKESSYVPTFRIRDRHGVETVEEGRAEDQFVAMLNSFAETVGDQTVAEEERKRIIGRALLMAQIWSCQGNDACPASSDINRKVNA